MNKKDASRYFEKMGGREGLAKRALEICQQAIASGSYKRAIAAAGQLMVIAEVSYKSNGYWSEIVERGYSKEIFYASNPKAIAPILDSDGRLSSDHWEAERAAGIR